MYRLLIPFFMLASSFVMGQTQTKSLKQNTNIDSELLLFGSTYAQQDLGGESKSILSFGIDGHLLGVDNRQRYQRIKSSEGDFLKAYSPTKEDVLRFYNLGNSRMHIGVSDSTNTSILGSRNFNGTLDLRQLSKGTYNINIASETGSFRATYTKNTDPMPPCEEVDPSALCTVSSFEENIVGIWNYFTAGGNISGRVKINLDGTYQDIKNTIISNGPIKTRTWYIKDDRIYFAVEGAAFKPKWKNFNCFEIIFDGQNVIPDILFKRSAPCLSDDENIFPGSYPVISHESERMIRLTDKGTSNYTYSVQFKSDGDAPRITEYILNLSFIDNDHPDGRLITQSQEYKRIESDQIIEFENGLWESDTISINALNVLDLLEIPNERLSHGDEFKIEGCVTLEDGRIFCHNNSPRFLSWSNYNATYDISLPVICDSNLEGSFEYSTKEIWCGSDSTSGTIEIIKQEGEGIYTFSDWSFGAYQSCYGSPCKCDLTFTDICGEITFTDVIDSYGDTWTLDSNIEKDKWTISWSNTYGESASSIIYYPDGGDWPFTLAE